jgi:hypothetical protein
LGIVIIVSSVALLSKLRGGRCLIYVGREGSCSACNGKAEPLCADALEAIGRAEAELKLGRAEAELRLGRCADGDLAWVMKCSAGQ